MKVISFSSTKKSVRHSNSHRYSQENINPQPDYKYCSTFTPNRSSRFSSSSQLKPKIIYDDSWFSNKQYNDRVTLCVDHLYEKFNNKTEEIPDKYKSLCSFTYQAPTGKRIHEKIYPEIKNRKLYLNIAVNGASKSMQGDFPLSNLNLNKGDFGDDAGMNFENRDYCFVGKLFKNKEINK
jgi:hypothetical protein